MSFKSAFSHRGYIYQIEYIAAIENNEVVYLVTIGSELSIETITIALLPYSSLGAGKVTWLLKNEMEEGTSLSEAFIQACGDCILKNDE